MTDTDIKNECELQYEQIKKAKERLEELRKICKHKSASPGLYSWRIGSILPAIICNYCGTPISMHIEQ